MVDPIAGRRADQMSGQEATGSGSPGSSGAPGRNGTSVHEPGLPFWASGGGERRDVPAGFGRSKRAASQDLGTDRSASADRPDRLADTGRSGDRLGRSGDRLGSVQRVSGLPPETPEPEPRHRLFHGREIGHMAKDSREPAWRRRLIIAVVLGVLFTIFTNWRVGLTVAVLAGIVDAIIRSRSSAASVAVGLTTGAQRNTKKELAKLERSGFRALHIREIPGSDQVIDHLLVGPTGGSAIDSEEWDKRLPVRTRNGRQLWHGPYSQKERLEHACWEAAQASELISNALGEDITVRPAMAVYGPGIPWGFTEIRGVDVFGSDKLRKYLRRHRAGLDMRLSPSDVERIYAAADKVLPPKH
jgi:hypothetical protein